MALITKGGFEMVGGDYAVQPDRSITEKNDGTLEGSITFRADISKFLTLPQIGSGHYDDTRLEQYQRSIVYKSNNIVELTGSYFGLIANITDPEITYAGGQNNDPIDTHPKFTSFAGTPANPLNGAAFDSTTEEFLGFLSPPASGARNFRGTQYYLTPSTMVNLSYWTSSVPKLKKRMSIHESIQGFKSPPDVGNYLMLDTPYRQVGSFYQVTEQYLGSGPDGWNPKIYGVNG